MRLGGEIGAKWLVPLLLAVALTNIDELNRRGLMKPDMNWTWDDVRALSRKLTDRGADGKTQAQF